MRLKIYLSLNGNSASKLAEEVGVAVSTITRAASGETLPNHATRKLILAATGGKVRPADLFAAHEDHAASNAVAPTSS